MTTEIEALQLVPIGMPARWDLSFAGAFKALRFRPLKAPAREEQLFVSALALKFSSAAEALMFAAVANALAACTA